MEIIMLSGDCSLNPKPKKAAIGTLLWVVCGLWGFKASITWLAARLLISFRSSYAVL